MSLFTQPYHDAVAQLTSPGAPFEVTTQSIGGQSLKAFSRAPMSLRDYLNAGRQHDDKLLLQYQGASWSFNQFFTAVDRLSQWMLTEKRITVGIAHSKRLCSPLMVVPVSLSADGLSCCICDVW